MFQRVFLIQCAGDWSAEWPILSWLRLSLRTGICVLGLFYAGVTQAQTLILVSIDGFRGDYLDIHQAPNIQAIVDEGVRVKRLQPIYPPNTFPGHLSLITGLPPTEHGIVDNHFCDRQRGDCYHMGNGSKDASWLKGMPLWNLAEAHGLVAASYFWPESDANWGGKHPTYTMHYSKSAPYAGRVAQVLNWLRLPEPVRPSLITLYFSLVDTMGHRFGPLSIETANAIAEVDGHIGTLWQGVKSLGLKDANILLVSDHGMAQIEGQHGIPESAFPDATDFKRFVTNERVTYYAQSAEADVEGLRAELESYADERWAVYDTVQLQAQGGGSIDLLPDLALITRPPAFFNKYGIGPDAIEGSHGFPLDVPEMAAFAAAAGTAFKQGLVIEQAHQLDVYPLAARVLGISPLSELPSDGGALLQALALRSETSVN